MKNKRRNINHGLEEKRSKGQGAMCEGKKRKRSDRRKRREGSKEKRVRKKRLVRG